MASAAQPPGCLHPSPSLHTADWSFSADWSIEALTLGTVVTGHMSYPQVVRQLCGRGGSLLLQLSLVFRCAGERWKGRANGEVWMAALRVS